MFGVRFINNKEKATKLCVCVCVSVGQCYQTKDVCPDLPCFLLSESSQEFFQGTLPSSDFPSFDYALKKKQQHVLPVIWRIL